VRVSGHVSRLPHPRIAPRSQVGQNLYMPLRRFGALFAG